MGSTSIPLSKLIDLALVTPEVGAVNFNILRTALLIIIQKMGLANLNVELKTSESTKIENVESVAEIAEASEHKTAVSENNMTKSDDSVIIVEKSKQFKKHSLSSFVETNLIVLATKLDALQTQVDAIDPSKMADTEALIESVRKKQEAGDPDQDISPIIESVQQVNLAKRLSAVEHALQKLASLAETLTEEYNIASAVLLAHGIDVNQGNKTEEISRHGLGSFKMQYEDLVEEVNDLKVIVEELNEKVQHMSGPTETAPFQEMAKSISEIQEIKSKVSEMKKIIRALTDTDDDGEKKQNMVIRLNLAETTLQAHELQLQTINSILNENVENLHTKFHTLEKEVNIFHEKLQAGSDTRFYHSVHDLEVGSNFTTASASEKHSTQSLGANATMVIQKLKTFEDELQQLQDIIYLIKQNQEKCAEDYKVMTKEIEYLSMQRRDTDDMLAGKADKFQVRDKVSYEHFDSTVEDVRRELNSIVEKINDHELHCEKETEEIEREVHLKLSKQEFMPMKEALSEKLKSFQEKLTVLTSKMEQEEAAGAKRKFLKDVNCISCDKEVVMNVTIGLEDLPVRDAVYPVKNVRPYLTYKLDKVRKQQERLPTGRNLIQFEEILKKSVKLAHKSAAESCNLPVPLSCQNTPDNQHLSKRYCGGSHTVTKPQQRVTRTGFC